MKKFYLTLGIIINVLFAFSQIPNPSFEQWTSLHPEGWRAFWNPPYSPYTFETQSTNAHDGNIAVKSEIILTGPVCNKSGLFTGIQIDSFYVPISAKPLELHGWYILNSIGYDKFTASVRLKSNGQIIGDGQFIDSITSATYQEFIAYINYTSSLIPDSFVVGIQFNGGLPVTGNCGSHFIVDDLSFQNFVSINELASNSSLNVYPNPFNDKTFIKLNVTDYEKIKVKVVDTFGRYVTPVIKYSTLNIEMDRGDLPGGIYFLELWDAEKLLAKTKLIAL